MEITIVLDDENGEEVTYRIPARWIICDRCEGDGTHSGDIVITGSDMAEMYADDWDARDEFVRSFRQGWYRCEECNGTGKVSVPDESVLSPEEARVVAEWWQEKEQEARWRAEDAAVRRAESGYAW